LLLDQLLVLLSANVVIKYWQNLTSIYHKFLSQIWSNILLLLLLQSSRVTATVTPVLSAEETKKRELASALFGGKGGINREGMLSVSSYNPHNKN